MLKGIISAILSLLLAVVVMFVQYFVFATLKVAFKNKLKGKHSIKERKKNFKKHFIEHRYINTVEFIKWVIIDLIRGKDRFKLFGIWCFTGYYGEGKSLGAVNFAKKMQKEHLRKDIKIYSNFDVKGQDGKVEKWEDLLNLPQNTILIFDEIQSTFASSRFSKFPIKLLWKLTQCRKRGLAIFCSSPVYSRMSIELRESTDYVIECRNIFSMDRMFIYEFYRAPKYEIAQKMTGLTSSLKKKQLKEFKYTLVAQDYNYSLYDTNQEVDRWDVEDKDTKNVSSNQLKKLENKLMKVIDARLKAVG